jgi:hypothetical protein
MGVLWLGIFFLFSHRRIFHRFVLSVEDANDQLNYMTQVRLDVVTLLADLLYLLPPLFVTCLVLTFSRSFLRTSGCYGCARPTLALAVVPNATRDIATLFVFFIRDLEFNPTSFSVVCFVTNEEKSELASYRAALFFSIFPIA